MLHTYIPGLVVDSRRGSCPSYIPGDSQHLGNLHLPMDFPVAQADGFYLAILSWQPQVAMALGFRNDSA